MKCAYVICALSSSLEQANNLREVQAMKRLSPHANIIQLHELILWVLECNYPLWSHFTASSYFNVAYHVHLICYFSDKETGTVSLICELMEMNIYEFIQGKFESMTSTWFILRNHEMEEMEFERWRYCLSVKFWGKMVWYGFLVYCRKRHTTAWPHSKELHVPALQVAWTHAQVRMKVLQFK